MIKEPIAMSRPLPRGDTPVGLGPRAERERGQMLVIFALAMVALVAMVGLIIDGGDTFLQRRDQQNVADAAAMAAGYAMVNGQSPTAAAQAVAGANGYTNGQDSTVVSVTVGTSSITVDVKRPHRNYFSGVVGMASWDVSTTATVQAGTPNAAYGAMPLIFNQKAFDKAGNKAGVSVNFDEPGVFDGDVPQNDSSFNWTVFCTATGNPCNLNSATADDLINSNGNSTWVRLDQFIGPLNSGAHTTLFNDLAKKIDDVYPVAIVNDAGQLLGWASFHLTGSVGGSTKQISGWFDEPMNRQDMFIDQSGPAAAKAFDYVVKLTN
ncbi:MAG: hypothetical protein HYX54_00160 [Chloroflexi bacterium]|nr:hypothetical protein [Chloroflexota bacterium]